MIGSFAARRAFNTLGCALMMIATVGLSEAALAQTQPSAAPSPAAASDPRAFIEDLSSRVFTLLRDRSTPEAERRRTLRAMLTSNFAIDQIGDRLIRRHRAKITPAQYSAYHAAFPGFVVGAYADRLEGFGDATLKFLRTVPRNATDTDVIARVVKPGKQPIETVWAVRQVGGRLLITNLTVSGINLALTQEADFDSYIQRQGFDALVTFMKRPQPTS